MKKKLSGILLAGGKSKRMGQDKAFVKYKGKELFRYPLKILEQFCDDIIISSSNERFLETGHKVKADTLPNLGPIGGLYTCLSETENEYSLVIGCDTPLLEDQIIMELINNINHYSIIIPLNANGLAESLIGIYGKSCVDSLKKSIEKKNYKMSDFLKEENTYYKTLSYSPSKLKSIFSNINTKQDFQSLIDNE